MPQFMLALYDSPQQMGRFQKMSPEEIQKVIDKYRAWGAGLRENGRFVASQKLKDEGGRVLRKKDGELRVVDGPFIETKEVLAGFYVIEASNYDDAVAQIQNCPHLEFGTIELREVDRV
jgi:hypothetical protein